jgi:sugar phosphate isomerase/epimerase
MERFAKLASDTGVRALYHTHSGSYLVNNAASLRLLLTDLDPHHVGAYLDTGHTAVNGGPIRQELDIIKPWLAYVAIKDMVWEKGPGGWKYTHAAAGTGIVKWAEVGQGLRECNYNGVLSLHAEYEAKDLTERLALARAERALLRRYLEQKAN